MDEFEKKEDGLNRIRTDLGRAVRRLRRRMSGLNHGLQLVFLVVLIIGILGLAGLLLKPWVYSVDPGKSDHAQKFAELIFGLLGAIDAEPAADAASVAYSALVRFVGAVVFGGVITSFLCALVDRFANRRTRGLLVPAMKGHFVVVGYGGMTADLVRTLLAPETPEGDLAFWAPQERPDRRTWAREIRKRRVLLCTGGNVETIRETLDSLLPRGISSRIVYAFGNMNPGSGFGEVAERLCLVAARQIYVLGDEGTFSAGDVENLSFAKAVGERLRTSPAKRPDGLPTPVFVRLDGGASFDFVKKISFETDPDGKAAGEIRSFFKPFSFTEGWARRIWGDATAAAGGSEGAPDSVPIDFAPLSPGTSVHLVVAGLTPMGEALVLQAARICHFPNGGPTRITVVDPDPTAEDAFFSRHPPLRDALCDVRIEFLPVRIESETARRLLRESALDRNRLLSVAVCFRHSDAALTAALNLPEEVYWHRLAGGRKNVRASYRENGARIWVFQEHRNGLSERAEHHPRYANLRPFGMRENGFTPWCLREACAMYLNAVYDWPKEKGAPSWLDGCAVPGVAERIAAFREKWKGQLAPKNEYGVFDIDATEKKDLLLAILAGGGDGEVRRFQEYAFRKYVLLKPELRWANLYVSDSYGVVFRALGLRAVYDRKAPFAGLARENDRLFAERREKTKPASDGKGNPLPGRFERTLAETEHNRWMADRALMGYRASRPGTGEIRDDDFRYHNDMIPFDRLSPAERDKDELSIACIPLFMALEGIRLEMAEGANG